MDSFPSKVIVRVFKTMLYVPVVAEGATAATTASVPWSFETVKVMV